MSEEEKAVPNDRTRRRKRVDKSASVPPAVSSDLLDLIVEIVNAKRSRRGVNPVTPIGVLHTINRTAHDLGIGKQVMYAAIL